VTFCGDTLCHRVTSEVPVAGLAIPVRNNLTQRQQARWGQSIVPRALLSPLLIESYTYRKQTDPLPFSSLSRLKNIWGTPVRLPGRHTYVSITTYRYSTPTGMYRQDVATYRVVLMDRQTVGPPQGLSILPLAKKEQEFGLLLVCYLFHIVWYGTLSNREKSRGDKHWNKSIADSKIEYTTSTAKK
jgi:hypothetical protein